jgi:hypothetical protein
LIRYPGRPHARREGPANVERPMAKPLSPG